MQIGLITTFFYLHRLTYIIQAKLTDRWLNRVLTNYTHCTRQPSGGSKALSITDILGGFVLWGAGIILAILLIILEVVTHKSQKDNVVHKYTTNKLLTTDSVQQNIQS